MNIFLVEDEHWALAELVHLFKIYKPEHTIYAFNNGDDALAAVNKIRPDLMLTDITMPGIDGLELIEQVLKIDASIRCILLTVHDQFSYAQQGLKLGVSDYLLKPIKKDELYQAVNKVILTIGEADKQKEELNNWSINQLLLDSSNNENSLNLLEEQDYCMVYLLAENWSADRSWHDFKITNNQLMDYFSNQVVPSRRIYSVDIDRQRKLMLIPIYEQMHLKIIQSDLHVLYDKVSEMMNIHVCFKQVKKGDSLNGIFEELGSRLENQMRFGCSTFITSDFPEVDIDLADIWGKMRIIKTLIQKGDTVKTIEVIDKIVRKLEELKITFRQLKLFLNNMYYALAYDLQKEKNSDVNIKMIENDFNNLETIVSFEDLSRYIERVISELATNNSPEIVAPKNLIPRIEQWIQSNYHKELLFQDFANEHHVSLSYLSREFKNQTGYTFSDYVVQYRMEKAKKFLNEGIGRISEVCRLVGYEDPKYFSTVFKRSVGVSPREYMNRNKENKGKGINIGS